MEKFIGYQYYMIIRADGSRCEVQAKVFKINDQLMRSVFPVAVVLCNGDQIVSTKSELIGYGD